jgi:hypothetical protein
MNKIFFLFLVSVLSTNLFAQALADGVIENDGSSKKMIAFTSDTQAPMLVETIILRSNKNRLATKKLFEDIGQRNPGSLFILGDVVNLGYSNRQWKPIDRYIKDLREKGVEVHAALGNHEVMGRKKTGEKKFQQRFPNHVKTGFVEVVDSVAVVLLNSNFKKLSKKEDDIQVAWYRETLKALDADPAIQFIITGCHHSPYTNSKIVGPSTGVQDRFVKPFLASEKSKLFLSGHCHGFEHYQVEGKEFVVIGGGGGLNQPMRANGAHEDIAKDYKPMFHYLTVLRSGDHLELKSYKLDTDFSLFEEGLVISVRKDPAAGTGLASVTADR